MKEHLNNSFTAKLSFIVLLLVLATSSAFAQLSPQTYNVPFEELLSNSIVFPAKFNSEYATQGTGWTYNTTNHSLNATAATDAYLFTPGYNLLVGINYKVTMSVTASAATSLIVTYGSAQTSATATPVDTLTIPAGTTEVEYGFEASADGVFYFGYQATSATALDITEWVIETFNPTLSTGGSSGPSIIYQWDCYNAPTINDAVVSPWSGATSANNHADQYTPFGTIQDWFYDPSPSANMDAPGYFGNYMSGYYSPPQGLALPAVTLYGGETYTFSFTVGDDCYAEIEYEVYLMEEPEYGYEIEYLGYEYDYCQNDVTHSYTFTAPYTGTFYLGLEAYSGGWQYWDVSHFLIQRAPNTYMLYSFEFDNPPVINDVVSTQSAATHRDAWYINNGYNASGSIQGSNLVGTTYGLNWNNSSILHAATAPGYRLHSYYGRTRGTTTTVSPTYSNDWAFTPMTLHLQAGTTYNLKYRYAVESASQPQEWQFWLCDAIATATGTYFTSATAPPTCAVQRIDSNYMTNAYGSGYLLRDVNFTPNTTGDYYLGVRVSYKNSYIYYSAIDSIQITNPDALGTVVVDIVKAGNGTITFNGVNYNNGATVTVPAATSNVFTIMPTTGNHVKAVYLDGVKQNIPSGGGPVTIYASDGTFQLRADFGTGSAGGSFTLYSFDFDNPPVINGVVSSQTGATHRAAWYLNDGYSSSLSIQGTQDPTGTTSYDWYWNSSYNHSPSNPSGYKLESYVGYTRGTTTSSTTPNAWAFPPEQLSLQAGTTYTMRYISALESASYPHDLEVWLCNAIATATGSYFTSASAPPTCAVQRIDSFRTTNAYSTGYLPHSFTFTPNTSGNYYIGLQNRYKGSSGWYGFWDSIQITSPLTAGFSHSIRIENIGPGSSNPGNTFIYVTDGANSAPIVYTPNAGNMVLTVLVDGQPWNGYDPDGGSVVFNNVQAEHSITFYYGPVPTFTPPYAYDIETLNGSASNADAHAKLWKPMQSMSTDPYPARAWNLYNYSGNLVCGSYVASSYYDIDTNHYIRSCIFNFDNTNDYLVKFSGYNSYGSIYPTSPRIKVYLANGPAISNIIQEIGDMTLQPYQTWHRSGYPILGSNLPTTGEYYIFFKMIKDASTYAYGVFMDSLVVNETYPVTVNTSVNGGAGATVTPTSQQILMGQDVQVAIIPDVAKYISNITVNGVDAATADISAVKKGGTFTVKNVQTNTNIVVFTGDMPVYTPPYTYDLDNSPTGVSSPTSTYTTAESHLYNEWVKNNGNPANATVAWNSNTNAGWTGRYTTSYSHTPSNPSTYKFVSYNGYIRGTATTSTLPNDWMFTPPLQFQAGTDYLVRFIYAVESASQPQYIKTWLCDNNVGTFASASAPISCAIAQEDDLVASNIYSSGYLQRQVIIHGSNITADGIYHIGFQMYQKGATNYYMMLDNIEVYKAYYDVTINVHGYGSATPMTQTLFWNTDASFDFTPDQLNKLVRWTINGVEQPLPADIFGGTINIPNITEDKSIDLYFEPETYITLPLAYDFGTSTDDEIWDASRKLNVSGNGTWTRQESYGGSGEYYMMSPDANNTEDYFITPPFLLTGGTYVLTLDAAVGSSPQNIDVYLFNADNTVNGITQLLQTINVNSTAYNSSQIIIPESLYTLNGTYRIGIKYAQTTQLYDYVTVDNISLRRMFTITSTASSGGFIAPQGVTEIMQGDNLQVCFMPNTGKNLLAVYVDGIDITDQFDTTGGCYDFIDVQADHNIVASFEDITYNVHASAGIGGYITPSGDNYVPFGDNITFTIGTQTHYILHQLIVDGVTYTATSGVWTETGWDPVSDTRTYEWTLYSVLQDHDVQAVFLYIPPDYFITANAGAGGTISPAGQVPVTEGQDITFTITPNFGHVLTAVFANGADVTDQFPNDTLGGEYTIHNVRSNGSIIATFRQVTYIITTAPGAGGSINPASPVVNYGDSVVLSIEPNPGYIVAEAYVDNKPATITNNTYTFKNVRQNHIIAVTFMNMSLPVYNIVATTNGHGTISPADTSSVVEGFGMTFSFIPHEKYELDSVIVPYISDTGIVNEVVQTIIDPATGYHTYTFTDVRQNKSIHAVFKYVPAHFHINVTSNSGGTVTPYGNVDIIEGRDTVINISASKGYVIQSITVDDTINVQIFDTTHSSYIFTNVWNDRSINIVFEELPKFNITAAVEPDAHGFISYNTTNMGDTIDVPVYSGFDTTFNIIPEIGYKVSNVWVDGDSVGAMKSYTFKNVVGPHDITATFEMVDSVYYIHATVIRGNMSETGYIPVHSGESHFFSFTPWYNYELYSITINGKQQDIRDVDANLLTNLTIENVLQDIEFVVTFRSIGALYYIDASATNGGKISPEGEIELPKNASQTFKFTPNPGFMLSDVLIDNVSIGITYGQKTLAKAIANGEYAITNIIANHTIEAVFVGNMYNVDIETNTLNGRISPNGHFTMSYGTAQILQFIPDAKYILDKVFVNNVEVPKTSISNNYYSLFVKGDTYVTATFKIDSSDLHINATAEPNGDITPKGDIIVKYSNDQAFTFHPNTGYKVDKVFVDDEEVSVTGNTYTFTNVTENHTINVTFREIINYTITATAGDHGTISPEGGIVRQEGEIVTFKFIPESDLYVVDSVWVDGVFKQRYDDTPVEVIADANHTIHVTFVLKSGITDDKTYVSVFPNPTQDIINVKSENVVIKSIEVMDLSGSILIAIENPTSDVINISSLSNGTYSIVIKTNNGVETHRVVKAK